MKRRWDEIADVVVAGNGCAGAVTAITAQEQGANVLLVEKQPQDSHCASSDLSGGFFMSPPDTDTIVKYLEALYRIPGELSWVGKDVIRVFAEYVVQNKAWVEAHGGQFREGHAGGEHPEVTGHEAVKTYQFAGMGRGLRRFLEANLSSKGIPVSYNTEAKRLITNSKGRVIGLEVERDNGKGKKIVRIGASKGVVLATGGFEYNEVMKLNYLPVHPTYFTGHTSATGDGIRMALSVGADLWHMNCLSGRLVAKVPGFPIAFTVSLGRTGEPRLPGGAQADPQKRPGLVLVDRDGKRFTNERYKAHSVYYELTYFDTHRLVYPRVPTYWIFDRCRMEIDCLVTRVGAAGPYHLYEWSKDNGKELEKGYFTTAKSIRELARKIDLVPDSLEKTINTYNEYCDKGKDLEFGRRPESLVPLDKPPFFAMKLWPGGPNTLGGPKRNAKSQVLNTDGEPIPCLYSAGEMGSLYGMLYPSGGSNLGECIAMGRVAGENVAHEQKR